MERRNKQKGPFGRPDVTPPRKPPRMEGKVQNRGIKKDKQGSKKPGKQNY